MIKSRLLTILQGMLLVAIILTLSSFSPRSQANDSQTLTLQDFINKACYKQCIDSKELMEYVTIASIVQQVDPEDLLAIITIESAFKPKARNAASVGLMQVNLDYHAKKFKTTPYNPKANVIVGAGIYKACLNKRNGNKAKALRCYNGENVKNMIYPNKVLNTLKKIKVLYEIQRLNSPEL